MSTNERLATRSVMLADLRASTSITDDAGREWNLRNSASVPSTGRSMSIKDPLMRYLGVAALFLLVACSERRNPESCAADKFCVDPKRPFCDLDGQLGGEPGKCIEVSCTPLSFEACRADAAIVCNVDGNGYDITNCPNGCDDTSGCRLCPKDSDECDPHIIPRYLPTICNQPATHPALTISMDTTLDTNNELSCSSVVAQQTGPEICVLHYDTITIERNQTFTVQGERAIALVADRALTIDGVLDIAANGAANGPGGGLVKSAMTVGGVPGGGAGARHPGGAGASNTADGGAANGGQASMQPGLLTELFGGTTTVHPSSHNDTVPGGGGGAATLISCRGTVAVPGLIDAGGGGGSGGPRTTPENPAGGGSGGTVVLQGIMVSVTGQVFANGGGGGGGSGINGSLPAAGGRGADGQRSTARAAGGVAAGTNGDGGAGGTTLPPGNGKKPVSGTKEGGAGGGSAGYLLIYMPDLVFPALTPAAVSPEFEPKGTVTTAL